MDFLNFDLNLNLIFKSTPGGTRTHDPLIKSQVLPAG